MYYHRDELCSGMVVFPVEKGVKKFDGVQDALMIFAFPPFRSFPDSFRDIAIVTAQRTCVRNLIRVVILSACERIIIARCIC